jgi:hypothetical protein
VFSVALIMALVLACATLDAWLRDPFKNPWKGTDAPLVVATVGSGLIAFALCAILSDVSGESWITNPSKLRTCIALPIIIQYMVLVGTVAFFRRVTDPHADHLTELAETLVHSFTTVVSVVVGSFFGASASVQIWGQERRRQGPRAAKRKTPDTNVGEPGP